MNEFVNMILKSRNSLDQDLNLDMILEILKSLSPHPPSSIFLSFSTSFLESYLLCYCFKRTHRSQQLVMILLWVEILLDWLTREFWVCGQHLVNFKEKMEMTLRDLTHW